MYGLAEVVSVDWPLLVFGIIVLAALLLLGARIPRVTPFGSTKFGDQRGQGPMETYSAEEEIRRHHRGR